MFDDLERTENRFLEWPFKASYGSKRQLEKNGKSFLSSHTAAHRITRAISIHILAKCFEFGRSISQTYFEESVMTDHLPCFAVALIL
jgi:hypothetical protein